MQDEVDRLKRALEAKRPLHLPSGLPFVGIRSPGPCEPNTINYVSAKVTRRAYVTAIQMSAEMAKRWQLQELTVGVDCVHDSRRHGVVLSAYDDGTVGLNVHPVIADVGLYIGVAAIALEAGAFEASVLGMPEESCTCHRVTQVCHWALTTSGPYTYTRRMPTTGCIVHRGM